MSKTSVTRFFIGSLVAVAAGLCSASSPSLRPSRAVRS